MKCYKIARIRIRTQGSSGSGSRFWLDPDLDSIEYGSEILPKRPGPQHGHLKKRSMTNLEEVEKSEADIRVARAQAVDGVPHQLPLNNAK